MNETKTMTRARARARAKAKEEQEQQDKSPRKTKNKGKSGDNAAPPTDLAKLNGFTIKVTVPPDTKPGKKPGKVTYDFAPETRGADTELTDRHFVVVRRPRVEVVHLEHTSKRAARRSRHRWERLLALRAMLVFSLAWC